MATLNPFDLLDDDAEDPSLLIAAQQQKEVIPAAKKGPAQPTQQARPAAKLPTKPLPPSQAVRESGNDGQRGGGRGGPRGGFRGRGGRGFGFNQDSADGDNSFGRNNGFYGGGGFRASEDGESGKTFERRGGFGGPRGEFRGGRRGGFSNGDAADGERPRRTFERQSGTGRGSGFKREGAGRANWGTPTDEFAPENEEPVNGGEKVIDTEKQTEQTEAGDAVKEDTPVAEPQEKEPEEKEMTLEEYEKVLEEKRKALLALKPEERKVNLDKEFASMQLLSNKKNDDEVFVKLGSEKDKQRKEAVEKAKKTKTINEFLKPADGESYYRGGRGRGRQGGRGQGGFGGNRSAAAAAPSIEDVGQFPSLGGK